MKMDVLLVDDDAAVRDALGQTLELADLRAIAVGSFVAAKDMITPQFEGVILSDMRMPGRDGFHLLNYTLQQDPDLPVVLLTGEGDIPMAVTAMREGAFAFLEKPCATDELLAVLGRALKTRSLVLENRRLRHVSEAGDPAARMLFGTSSKAEALRGQVRMVAQKEADALVFGAPGTGVSKVAEVIHLSSARSKTPFVKAAASDLTPDRLSKLVEEAEGGSLFLDEIAQLPAQLQLLLEERRKETENIRLMGGTTRNLQPLVQAGDFSADLFYRLDALRVRIPSLSERPEDIPEMFRRYVAQAAEQAGQKVPEIAPDMIARLMARDWPGNTRALMSVAMRFVMGLPDEMATDTSLGLAEQMSAIERSLLAAALRRASGRASVAAKALKLPRKTFYDKLARYGMRPDDYRE